jgi:hypothetical protein
MAFYRVLVEGSNLRIPGNGSSPGIVGFYTTRVVYAATSLTAESKALESVRREWQKPEYSTQPGSQSLDLAVSEVGPATVLRWFSAPNRGFTFFSDESPSEA